MAGISSNALKGANYSKNRKEFNGIEHTTDLDMNQYDAFYRTLDPQLGRWWQIDPKPDYMWSPYSAMNDNPISKADFLGDTARFGASLSQAFSYNGKQVNGSDLAQKTVKEWSKIGGVKLGINATTGEVEFKGNAKGKYSETGRQEVMALVTGQGQVTVDFSTGDGSHTSGNNIFINPSEVGSIVKGTSSDLDPLTLSFGMVGLHEFGHTKAGGGDFHGPQTLSRFGQIDMLDIKGNAIRQEMSAITGSDWGQRSSYSPMSINGVNYLPFSFSAKQALERSKLVEGRMGGDLVAPIPTKQIIAISAY
ncbi:RHS repeat-associated protein [Chitinophaga niastensis]|uniref:RHS repeat-associated protein n=2 Tax=Chitinophaga niastensis TaxID=536980 RepID=A0A2P8HDZ7_CHINA|nr:RHS repeat-associated protein [Chitinophaga niastensis]